MSCASTALYMDASEQALVTTFSTLTTRHAEFSLAANVLYQILSPVFRTTAAAQHAHGHVRYTSHVHSWSSRRPKNFKTSSRPTLVVSSHYGQTINSAINLAATYCSFGRLAESKKILREQNTIARHRGPDDHMVLTLRAVLAETVIQENDPTEAVAIFEDVDRRMRRVLGPAHPQSQSVRRGLEEARAKLLAFHDAADGA